MSRRTRCRGEALFANTPQERLVARTPVSYFYGSIGSIVPAVLLGYWFAGWRGAWIVLILSILETSLSLDNAVVNAQILKHWNHTWRQAFIIFGLPVAVFGMRLVFPIIIVSVTTGLGSLEVVKMAIDQPDDYARALTAVHHEVAAFGGAFLMMVFLHFFVDITKDEHWLRWIEAPLTKLGQIEAVEVAITMLALFATSVLLDGAEKHEFIVAGAWGLITYVLAKGFASLLGGAGTQGRSRIVHQGIGGFVYIELLDASFSFDGVIGAFALSNNLFVIAIGLGVGAMFVRSMTIFLVDRGTLGTLRYLEHGAFWAIGALATIMFIGVRIEIPEAVTGLIGAVLIFAAGWHSVMENRKAGLTALLKLTR